MSDDQQNDTNEQDIIDETNIQPPTEQELKDSETLYEEAMSLYKEGDFLTAVGLFSSAVGTMSAFYGSDHEKLAEPYFYYGDSLLMSAKMRMAYLESNMDLEEIELALDKNLEGNEDNDNGDVKDTDLEVENFLKIIESEDKLELVNNNNNNDEKGDEKGDSQDDISVDEEIEAKDIEEDLKLSWDILELSRVLQERKEKPDMLALSDVHQALGNVAFESSNVTDGIKEYEASISIREKISGPDSRPVAEGFYLLGLGLMQSADHFERAKKSFQKALDILNFNLNKCEAAKEKEKIDELNSIISEINERIEEVTKLELEESLKDDENDSLKEENNNSNEKIDNNANNNNDNKINKGNKRKLSNPEEVKVVKKKKE
jgi:TolA-binding protein